MTEDPPAPSPNPQVEALLEQGVQRQAIAMACRERIADAVAELVAAYPDHIKLIGEICEGHAQNLQREYDAQQLKERRRG